MVKIEKLTQNEMITKIKSILIFVCAIGLIGCNSIVQKRQEQKTADSLKVFEQNRIDSIANVERLEFAKKAYADAKFGMSSKEVSELPHFKDWLIDTNYRDIRYDNNDMIGNRAYKVSISFHNNQLYMVSFSSLSYKSATYLDTEIANDVENLKEIITNSCGYPTGIASMPSVVDLNPTQTYLIYQWIISTKFIEIGIYEKSSGSEYMMKADMWDKNLMSAILQEVEKAKKEEKAKQPVLF